MKFVLWGTYSADALEKRTPFREEHLAGLRRQKEQGVLLTIGPTADTTHVFGLYEAASGEEVETLVRQDVYWREGIWTALEVHPWIQAL
ncbi:MAG: YciI family protein [Cyanobacteriota bacterium]